MRLHFAVAECYSFSCREEKKFNFATVRLRKGAHRGAANLFCYFKSILCVCSRVSTKVSC
jgi:hypothetical protein